VQSEAADLARRFGALYSGVIADILDELGRKHQTLPPAIEPLRQGMRMAGPAFVAEGRPNVGISWDDSVRAILRMLGDVPAGHVLVSQSHDTGWSCAHLGELSATSLQARGCAGAVIDGGCRDIRHILELDFPVFCRYTTPRDALTRWEAVRWGHEAGVGDVLVATGDYVLADDDGVVVVPAGLIETVLERAEELASTEDEVREAVRQGVAPLDAFERFGKF